MVARIKVDSLYQNMCDHYIYKTVQESVEKLDIIKCDAFYKPVNDIILDAILQYISVRKLNEASWDVNDFISDKVTEIANSSGYSYYFAWNRTVGSYGEGMGLLGNDVDKLCINRRQHHVIADATTQPKPDELLIDTSQSYPGYCRIKFHKDNIEDSQEFEQKDFVVKIDNEVYLKNSCISEEFLKSNEMYSYWNKHGPALTSDILRQDFVLALQCRNSASLMSDFLSRKRKWPSRDIVEKLKTTVECSVVAASHSLSKNPDIEYRLSFAESEKFLIRHMNDIQFAVYCYLKQIKSTIENDIEDLELLRSYYIKTVVLWICEILDPSEWQSENFLRNAMLCLEVLRKSYQNGRLPSIFKEENNLIESLSKQDRHLIVEKIVPFINDEHAILNTMKALCDGPFERCYERLKMYKGRYLTEYLKYTFKQFSSSSFPLDHISVMIETETISHFCSVFVAIDMHVLCQTLEVAILSLPSIIPDYSPRIQDTIRVMLCRYLGDCLHSYYRISRRFDAACVEFYTRSKCLILPVNGIDDGGLSGNTHLALFHYLNMEYDKVFKDIGSIDNQLLHFDITSALSLCITETTKDRFSTDEFLYNLILKALAASPPPHGYVVFKYPALALYMLVRIGKKINFTKLKMDKYRKIANSMVRRIEQLDVEEMFVDTLALLSKISLLLV